MRLSSKSLPAILVASMIMTACNPLGKMSKRASEVNYTVTPNPMEMHADSVSIEINGSFPTRFFHKKVAVDVVPVLKYGGKETKFETLTLAGELSEVEGQKINYEQGGSFKYNAQVPYEAGMERAVLELEATGKYKTATKAFDGVKIADGTNVNPLLLQEDDKPMLGKDNFQKVVPVSNYAEIHYLINRSQVRPGELRDEDMKAMKAWIENGVAEEYTFKSVQLEAYASPDGEITLNENLANERAESAAKAMKNMLKRAKAPAGQDDSFYGKNGKGEDWAGFKKAMEASDIKDKNLILRVLEMYNEPMKREEEIKNLAATYVEVAEKILPTLRRSQITINAEEKSKTDEEIASLADSAPDSLKVEELLYAATLTDDINKKLTIYQSCSKVYPEDWRGPNNVGYIYVMQNKVNEAKAEFDKAATLNVNSAVINNNLGVIERINGNLDKAIEYFESAEGAGNEVSQNLGMIYVKKGDYDKSNQYYQSTKSFNAALSKLLSGDPDGAAAMINEIEDKDAAHASYLKAIVNARNKNKDSMISNLKAATGKDASYKAKAKDDIEFRDYENDAEFQAAVN